MQPDDKPMVFIGSSKEGLDIAEAVQRVFGPRYECTVWTQGVFGPGAVTIEKLLDAVKEHDFGIFVFRGDDVISTRGATQPAPRDNVLFELGLFAGAHGRHRVFMLMDESANTKLASDLAGVIAATYAPPTKGNWDAAVGGACSQIVQEINARWAGRTLPAAAAVHLQRNEIKWSRFNGRVRSRYWVCGTSLAPLVDNLLIDQFAKQGARDIRILLPETEKLEMCSLIQLKEYDRIRAVARIQVQDARSCFQSIKRVISGLLEKGTLGGVIENYLRTYHGTMYANFTISDEEAYVAHYGRSGAGNQAVALRMDRRSNRLAYEWAEREFLDMWNSDPALGDHQ